MTEKKNTDKPKKNASSVKERLKINFIIDALMFLVIMAAGGIGLLMKYVLVPGSERFARYGADVDLYLWGWDRHQWGALHLVLGYVLLGLLVLHIAFHWTQIKCMYRNLIRGRSLRILLTVLIAAAGLILFLFAFVIKIETLPVRAGEGGHRLMHLRHETGISRMNEDAPDPDETAAGAEQNGDAVHHGHEERTPVILGSMTLREVEQRYGVPADSIKQHLGIPLNVSSYENLGRLRKRYGFHMSDVERYIEKVR